MTKKPYILGAIFARGGSKGVPRKNIRPLNGKPLIAYAIEIGLALPLIDHLIVSTDDKEIATVARQCGAEVPFMRPSELARDDSPELLAWKHAIETMEKQLGYEVDILVSIPTTSPLRNTNDVKTCLELLINSDADLVITATESERSPYFNMITLDAEKNAKLAILPLNGVITRRQDAPKVYDMTTVAYAARADYIKKTSSIMAGKVKTVLVPSERAFDIDTLLDFEIAEYLIKRKQV
ncbi:MAG: acylneuraminate cytidylyltransferase family protein [bacterium]|nr:acylneuraminate cytidylyltransferase family protein [bacterium]